jgi:hypothetical protein
MSENDDFDRPNSPAPLSPGQKRFLAGLGGILLLALVAGAWYLHDIGAFSSRPGYDRSWAYCDAGDSCTAIRAPCDSWVAINDKHLDEARTYYDHMIGLVEESPQMECASAPQGDIQPKAYCLSGLCMTAR